MRTGQEWSRVLAVVAGAFWVVLVAVVATATADDGVPIDAGLLALFALAAAIAAVALAGGGEHESDLDERVAVASARSWVTARALVLLAVLSSAGAIWALNAGRAGLALLGLSVALVCALYAYVERSSAA